MVATQKYIRKPLYVDAVRITDANFDDIAKWCQGEIEVEEAQGDAKPNRHYIRVRVHNPKNTRQTKAFVGDWLLYTERGYKVYTNKAFHASFNLVTDDVGGDSDHQTNVKSYPYQDGDVTVLGPEIFVGKIDDGLIICWKGDNFVPQETPMEKVEMAPATPESIAEAVMSNEVSRAVTEAKAAGKRVITEREQREMTDVELRELLKSGDVVLAQDLAA